ncbi:aspartate carbamoyltransferase regulatory subunit [Stygiolobus caldivivus]|uniref:Aspartate carbamoyltransferase regulatory chain n=1 Tax=Stygiolobus caldivivus TaxID=2824673 RepID=A0A8D5U7V2_9CREN|nr:aspartate carbamoyltransferase regulatory subunit [Stygiolobus caldivivus]BCU71380.1 aspartate carbamoyltransferase regulatory subunit [Stygiolobus caldivivus]
MEVNTKKELLVSKIRNGTVIDHIPAGRALAVLKVLNITGAEGLRVAIVLNVESKRIGKKDIVKIEDKEVNENEANIITLIAPTATINIIRDYEVVEKKQLKVPTLVKGVLKCPNPHCITNNDIEAIPIFKTIKAKPLVMRCEYCEIEINENDVLKQILGSPQAKPV